MKEYLRSPTGLGYTKKMKQYKVTNCLLMLHRFYSTMRLRKELERTGHLWPTDAPEMGQKQLRFAGNLVSPRTYSLTVLL